ncbi:MAG: hypothetical protein BWY92_00450 [Firmicutes bacterium ADurb.BinA052]|nr:MAG: hypothetical protein BWY92_00450 [Firmicutes bacterium ADurb.BinA052]
MNQLPIRPLVFVAEAGGQLEVAIEARYHQQLLVQLRALRKRVKHAREVPAGHNEVSRALGRAADKQRGLDLNEILRFQPVTHGQRRSMTRMHVGLQRMASEVDIPVPQPGFLIGQLVLGYVYRQNGRCVAHDVDVAGDDLDLSRGDCVVPGAFGALRHRAPNSQHAFAVYTARTFGSALRGAGLHHNLGEAIPIAQGDEDQTTMVAH